MKIVLRSGALLLTLAVFACVTINIYFPAEEVRSAADRIVHEVWGQKEGAAPAEEQQPAPDENKGSSLLRLFGPVSAYAATDINVSTPEIRAIRQSMKERAEQLFPYLDRKIIGIGNDGYLKIRTTEGLDLRARSEVTRLVKAENEDRQRLYQEIARANGFPEKADEVRSIFADSWRSQAKSGWYLETSDGSWRQK